MLNRKSALIVLSLVLALALCSAASLAILFSDGIDLSFPDSNANAAITAATSFGALNNGAKYYYSSTTAGAADIAVTVNSSAAHGSQTNPYVIDTKERWVFFANVITNQTSGYTGTAKYWVLNADIDLGANSIYAVGRHSTGFQGTLYGNKHSIKNGTITYQTWIDGTSNYAVGLFHKINGGKVYDLSIDSTIKFTMITNLNGAGTIHMGGLCAYAVNGYAVNVHCKVSMSNAQTGSTYTFANIGGIFGGGTNMQIYKCSYNGTIYYKTAATSYTNLNSGPNIGGIMGHDFGTGTNIIDQCAVTGTVSCENNGAVMGGLVGFPIWGSTVTAKYTNCILNVAVKMLGTGTTLYTVDQGIICGEDPHQLKSEQNAPTVVVQNIYIVGNSKVYQGTADTTGVYAIYGMEGAGTVDTAKAVTSKIYMPISTSTTVGPTQVQSAGVTSKLGSTSAVVTEANKNTSITSNYTVSSTGAITNKNDGATGNIAVNKGAGATGGANDTTYNYNANPQNISLAAPTRTGYTFKGWALTGPTGTVTNSSNTSYLSLPAGQRGNINAYAVWELKAFGGTAPSAATINYGSNATLTAAGVTHEATTTNTSYGVNISYQWQTVNGSTVSNISNATSSTYSITKPNAGTHSYRVVITATPKDGITPKKSTTYNVTLTVNKIGVPTPTVASGLIYSGNEQTGISTSSSFVTFSGTTKATAAGSYSVTASLTDTTNYCWGSTGGSDSATKSYTWSIAKATVAVPTITAGKTLTYNGANQKPTISSNSLYSCVNNGATVVGNYSVNVTLNNTNNYKWASLATGMTNESGAYPLAWSIVKADITLTAPSFTAVGGRAYVGQTVSNLTITQTTGTHVRAGSSTTVEGTYAWELAANTRIASTTTGLVAVFTPDDTTNYNTAKVTVSFTPVQLYLNVYEVRLVYLNASGVEVKLSNGQPFDSLTYNFNDVTNAHIAEDLELIRSIASIRREVSSTPVAIPVDYNKQFDLSMLNVNRGGTVQGNTESSSVKTLNWQMPKGYNMEFYTGINGNNEGTGSFSATLKTPAITSNLTVYIGYTGKQVEYQVVTVRQDLEGTHTPTNAEIIAALDSPDGLESSAFAGYRQAVSVTTKTAAAGTRVSASNQTIEGFTRKNSLTASGNRTYISDDQSKFVLGVEKTILITYYERNTYTVTWTFTGGTWKTSTGGSVSNRLSYRLKYGEKFADSYWTEEVPHYEGYTFDTWYTDSALTSVAKIHDTMPGYNVTLYAGRSSVKYKVNYDFNYEYFQNLNVSDGYYDELMDQEDNWSQLVYTIEQIINNGAIRLVGPNLEGFRFNGWVYYDEDDTAHTGTAHKLSNITRTTARDYDLVATWEPIKYTVSLNTQNNIQYSPSTVLIDNLGKIPYSVGGYAYVDGSEWDYMYDDDYGPDDFYMPTRPGFTFQYWYFKHAQTGAKVQAIYGEYYDVKLYEQTLYAEWEANPVRIKYADDCDSTHFTIAITSSDYQNGSVTFTPAQTTNNSYLYKDSTLTITVTPNDGYDIDFINVGGSSFNNGGKYVVRTYENDTIVLNVQLRERRFNITYVWDGGTFISDSTTRAYPRTFVLSETIDIIGGSLVYKQGYKFNGWHLNDPSGYIQGDALENVSPIAADTFGPFNTILYAEWVPAPVTMVYHNNRIGTDGVEKIHEDNASNILTGATIDLYQPANDDFTPENYELIGWSLNPDDDITYNVSYRYIYDGDNSYFEPQPVSYNVQPSADNTNHLYAKWRVTNVQYLTFEAANNNTVFRTDSDYEGVTLTARPRYSYTQDSNLKLKFSWYKVDPTNPIWQKWSDDDLEGLKDDEYNQAQSNVAIGMYKVPDGVRPIWESNEISYVAPIDQKHSYTVKNVKDSGLYLCMLEATGTYFSSTGGFKTSTTKMYGQYEVIINKADLDKATLSTSLQTSIYNGEQQGIYITWPENAGWNAEGRDIRVLPDSSKIKVNYTYILNDEDEDEENDVKFTGSVRDVGSYRVVASFEFLNDKGNYNLPNSLNGQFEITRYVIDEVEYELQTLVDGQWVRADSQTSNQYCRQEFRVVATPVGLMQSDRGLVEIVMYYDGNETHSSTPLNVGDYVAYCDALVGTDLGDNSANYILSSLLPSKEFSITKADHKITVDFEDETVTYDGNLHELAIESIVEGGVNKEILSASEDGRLDSVELADGCTLTIEYSISPDYIDARFTPANDSYRGGIHAGTYTVTIRFIDTDENAINFNKFDDMTATLTIKQAPYCGDGQKVGLTDEQLQRYITVDGKRTPNPNGFGDAHTVEFQADMGYVPALDLDEHFDVDYTYLYKSQDADATFVTLDKVEKFILGADGLPTFTYNDGSGVKNGRGLHEAGTYRVTAAIAYADPQYANDYMSIADYTVELKITPGTIKEIKVICDQEELEDTVSGYYSGSFKGYTYGDSFDFYEVDNHGNYLVAITAVYVSSTGVESSEVIDPADAQFLNESGKAFERFDRATILEDTLLATNTPVTPDSSDKVGDVYYKIKVRVYGEEGVLKVKVRQATLSYDTIGFDSDNDNDIHRVGGMQWTYGFTYDGNARYPALSTSIENAAYNFVGVEGDKLVSGTDVVATYTYTDDDTVSGGSEFAPLPTKDNKLLGLADAGIYNIRVSFTNNNKNYKPIDDAATRLSCRVDIKSKELAPSDILWQYCGNEHFGASDTSTLQADKNLTYRGQGGFYVRAVFRNLAVTNLAASNYYLNVDGIALVVDNVEGDEAGYVKITNQGTYSIHIITLQTGNANYSLPGGASSTLTATVTIDPAEVELKWSLTGGGNTLTYNGLDQLGGATPSVQAHYNIPEGFTESEDNEQITTIKVDTFNGQAVTDGTLMNAGLYTLAAKIADENYTAKNPTYNVTVKPYTVAATSEDNSWWYQYGSTDFIAISQAANGVDYIGKDIPVFVQFATIGDDLGDTALSSDGKNYRRVEVKDALDNTPRNAGTYEMSLLVDSTGNYDLSNLQQTFVINKKVVEVNWQEQNKYIYTGEDITVYADAKGVGDEENDTIIVLSDATKRNANQGNADWYITYATVADQYVNNYSLKEASGTNGSVGFIWTINKKEIGVTWDTANLVYNNGYDITEWSYEVTGRVPENENMDNVDLQYEVYLLTAEGEQKVRNMNVAGEYRIKVVGLSNSNYSFAKIEDHSVIVDKATPVVSNVVYREYVNNDNVTYKGNTHGLRNDKLTYVAMCGENEVAGTIAFADSSSAAIASVGTNYHTCVFTPKDTNNYNSVEYSQLRIEVRADSISRLGFDSKSLMTIYAVGQKFSPFLVSAYFEYASYYEETVNNVKTSYGTRVAIEDNADVTFQYNNAPINMTSGYTFTENDIGEQVIYAFALDSTNKTRRGEIKITVLNSIPTAITITNKKELEEGKYYVGSTFDKYLAEFFVSYQTESSDGPVSADLVEVTNATLTSIGTWKITFTYVDVTASITITVSPKEVIKIADPSGTYRYADGDPIYPIIKQANGDPLPIDITSTISDEYGNPANIREEGTYTIIVKFDVDSSKYEAIDPVTATIVVRKIVAILDPASYREPQLERVYTGEALKSDDYVLRGQINVIDNESRGSRYEIVETVYTVNGQPIEGYEIREAGEYKFVIYFTVKSVVPTGQEAVTFPIEHEYTIVIKPAVNSISTFTINSWIYGVGTGVRTFKSAFGEDTAVFEYYLLDDASDEEGVFAGYSLPIAVGRYRAVVTVDGTNSYSTVSDETFFEIRKPAIFVEADVNGEPMVNTEGNNIVEVKRDEGVDPYYNLRVQMLKDTSDYSISKQVVVSGYKINIVDSNNEVVKTPGEHTVRIWLTAEQRDAKNYKNPKVYIVDEWGVEKEIKGAEVDKDGYLVFKTDNFDGTFIVSARDAASIAQMWWIIGLCVGGVIALVAIIILIVVVIKKKKEND